MSLPPVEIPQGAIRFNTDSQKLEFYAQDQWWEMVIDTPNLGASSDTGAGARGLFAGQGISPVFSNVIDYVNISSAGNALDFGDLSSVKSGAFGCSSSTRGLFSGGYNPTRLNVIDYITISSTGDVQDFGDLIYARQAHTSCSNSTRGLFAGGFNPQTTPAATTYNAIDYATIASTGNAQDFGDLSRLVLGVAAVSSSTRGVFAGGTPLTNTIEFVTISTLGNSQDFGDLTYARQIPGNSTAFNPIRGIFGSNATPHSLNYITISTLGNSVNFGNLSLTRRDYSGVSSSTRGVFGGGSELFPSAVQLNTIDYVTILTQGNAVDFGDLTLARGRLASLSNAHGGL
jgi:hypothetical protein